MALLLAPTAPPGLSYARMAADGRDAGPRSGGGQEHLYVYAAEKSGMAGHNKELAAQARACDGPAFASSFSIGWVYRSSSRRRRAGCMLRLMPDVRDEIVHSHLRFSIANLFFLLLQRSHCSVNF